MASQVDLLVQELTQLHASEATLRSQLRALPARIKVVEKALDWHMNQELTASIREVPKEPAETPTPVSQAPTKRPRSSTPPSARSSSSSDGDSDDSDQVKAEDTTAKAGDQVKAEDTTAKAGDESATIAPAPSGSHSAETAPAVHSRRRPGDIPMGKPGWIPKGECKSRFKRHFFAIVNTGYRHQWDGGCLKGGRRPYDEQPPLYSDSD
jgi:hypothetical protein